MTEEKLSYFVGLDIGTTAVRCVVGELGTDSNKPNIIGYAESENTGMRKGNVANIDEVADAIARTVQEAQRMSGREIKAATINVNGAHVQGLNSKGVIAITSPNREISLDDRMRVEEAATIVQLPPNKDIIQVFAKNYRLDGQDNLKDPIGMHGVRLEVDTHIVVASTPALKSLEQALVKADLLPNHRTVTGLGAAEVVLDRNQKESGVAVVDIGAATTNLTVIEDGEVEHIAVIPMGGIHITNDLAYGLRTELDVAEMIKLKYASLNQSTRGMTSFVHKGEQHTFDKEMIRLIVEARVEELLEYIDKELKKIRKAKKLPGGVTFVGGTASLPGLADYTKDTLQMPARIGKWNEVKSVVGDLDSQRYAPAVGLMLLDMYLGPAGGENFTDAQPGILTSVFSSMNKAFKRVRHSSKK